VLNAFTAAQHHHRVIDTTRANPARVWNYWLGGKDNYPIDQDVGEQIRTLTPGITDIARASRGFLLRAVRHLADAGKVDQFLDIGADLPTLTNTHEVTHPLLRAPDTAGTRGGLVFAVAARSLPDRYTGRGGYVLRRRSKTDCC